METSTKSRNKHLKHDFPKVMWVWDYDESDAKQRVVFAHKCGSYIAWCGASTFEEAEETKYTYEWNHAKDIEPEETTLEEVCKELGREIKIIK